MIATLLALLTQIASLSSQASVVTKIIEALIELIPTIVQEVKDLLPEVKGIIAALSENPTTTADQLATLKALDKQVDDAFEAAAAAAQAEDATTNDSQS